MAEIDGRQGRSHSPCPKPETSLSSRSSGCFFFVSLVGEVWTLRSRCLGCSVTRHYRILFLATPSFRPFPSKMRNAGSVSEVWYVWLFKNTVLEPNGTAKQLLIFHSKLILALIHESIHSFNHSFIPIAILHTSHQSITAKVFSRRTYNNPYLSRQFQCRIHTTKKNDVVNSSSRTLFRRSSFSLIIIHEVIPQMASSIAFHPRSRQETWGQWHGESSLL